MKGRTRATVLSLCLLSLLIVAVAFALHPVTPPAPALATNAAPNVPLAQAAYSRYVTRIRAFGRVGAPSGGEAKLAFAGSGIVAKIEAHVGESVGAGASLAQLDTTGLAIDVAQTRNDATAAAAAYGDGNVPTRVVAVARARLVAARERLLAEENGSGTAQSDRSAALASVRQSEAKLAADRTALDRAAVLYRGGVTAQKDVEAARETLALDLADADANRAKAISSGASVGAALVQARADVAQAQSDVRTARAQVTVMGAQSASAQARYEAACRLLAMGTLRAPAPGIVRSILKHSGEAVDPTQVTIVLGPARVSEITLTVSGDDARRIRAGDVVAIRINGHGVTGGGRVSAIVPGVDPATQTTTVVVDGAGAGWTPGDMVEATIEVAERRGIVIPTSAIVEDPQSGLSIVFVRERVRDGTEKFVSREISVASGDDSTTLVERGLRSGERIASQGAFDLLAPSGG